MSGDYQLQFTRGVPSQIVVYNYPFATSINNLYSQAVYATDVMAVGRVTLNFGVRWERYHNFYPEQTRESGQFSVHLPGQDLSQAGRADVDRHGAPRGRGVGRDGERQDGHQGLVRPVRRHDGRSLLERVQPERRGDPDLRVDRALRDDASSRTTHSTTRAATSPGLPGQPARRARRISATGGLNSVHQSRSEAEQDLRIHGADGTRSWSRTSPSARATSTTRSKTCITNLQYLRPVRARGFPRCRRRRSWTGTAIRSRSTPIRRRRSGRHSTSCRRRTRSTDRADTFHSFEVAATKRFSKKWTGDDVVLDDQEPSVDHQRHDQRQQSSEPERRSVPARSRRGTGKRAANVTYNLPLGLFTSVSYRAQSGRPGQRTQVFTAPRNRPSAGLVTLRMGEYGESAGTGAADPRPQGGEEHRGRRRARRLELTFQVFNALNASGVTGVNYLTGTQFGQVTGITSARVARIGAGFTF